MLVAGNRLGKALQAFTASSSADGSRVAQQPMVNAEVRVNNMVEARADLIVEVLPVERPVRRWKQAPLCGIFIMAGRSSGNWAACAGVLVLVRIFGPSPRPKKQKIIRIVDPFFAIIRFGVHRLQWLRVMAFDGSETPSAKAIVGLYGITDSYAKLISFYSCNDNSVCMYELRTWVTIKLASSCLANFVVMSVYYVILVFSCYCSYSLTIPASTVISDLKRVNYGSQVGRIVITESADGTLRTTSIMSNSEYPKLKYSISLEIVHTKQWCLLSGFENNSIATGQCQSNLPSKHDKREILGNDLTSNTDRFTQCLHMILPLAMFSMYAMFTITIL
ncbi:hypothetical protein S83_008877 [Arachis hypogaea]